jgi:hypothetical protein
MLRDGIPTSLGPGDPMVTPSPAGGLEPARPAMTAASQAEQQTYMIARGTCPRDEFNALRDRLQRSVRRDVDPVPAGHVGLLVQAIARGDHPLLTVYGHVRAGADPADAFAALERRLRRLLA